MTAAGRRSFLRSLGFAWNGLAEGAARDRNLRIHLFLGVLAGVFAARAPIAAGERALVVLCVALVVAAEAANSALEAAVDLAAPGLHETARRAKDASAGAVLSLAAGSVLVFLAVGGHRPATLLAAGALGIPGAGALAAAAAAAFLPSPAPRPLAADAMVAAGGLAGLVAAGIGAPSQAGTAAAAACLAIAMGGAARRRRRAE